MGAAGQEAIFVTDATGTIVAFSRGAELLLGYTAAEVLGVLTPGAFHPPEELDALAAELGLTPEEMFVAAPQRGRSLKHEWVFVRRDGSRFDGSLNVSGRVDSNGAPCGFVTVARDITEHRRHQAELTQRADFDDLTGLANRAYLKIALNEAAKDTSWSRPGRILLFIDLDRFKQVNDTLGHAAGDAVLVGVAERLSENLRNVDLAARVGGDEFVVLLGQISPAAAAEVAERIVGAIARPFDIHGAEATIGASVGLATSSADINPEALLLAADVAAYSAKHAGRGRVVAAGVHSPGQPGGLGDGRRVDRVQVKPAVEHSLLHLDR
jgi:diguanylate cyclase (GGDEF)-like protein/PAS domain S-box-containing protein